MNPALPPILEKEFMAQIAQLARIRGWRVFHDYDSRRSVPGFPDMLLIRGEQILVFELKVGRRKTTPEQEDWLAAFLNTGKVGAYTLRPTDWPLIETLLEKGTA
jgi:hypothetical protein